MPTTSGYDSLYTDHHGLHLLPRTLVAQVLLVVAEALLNVRPDAGDVPLDLVQGEEGALGGLAAGVA